MVPGESEVGDACEDSLKKPEGKLSDEEGNRLESDFLELIHKNFDKYTQKDGYDEYEYKELREHSNMSF